MDSLTWAWVAFGLDGARIAEIATGSNHTKISAQVRCANPARVNGAL